MKRIKSLVALLAVAAILFMLPFSQLTASAADPITYVVKYMDATNGWIFQANGTSKFVDSAVYGNASTLRSLLRNGDIVVVYSGAADEDTLNLGDVHLSNLTIVGTTTFPIINVKAIDDCYVLADTSSAINADITNVHVYDSVLLNLGKNVTNLTLHTSINDITSNIGCSGTVEHFHSYLEGGGRTFYDCYRFKADTFSLQNGQLKTAFADYTLEKPAVTPTPAPVAPQKPASDASDYDDVPKTGENNLVLWFLGAAAISAIASICLSQKNHNINRM